MTKSGWLKKPVDMTNIKDYIYSMEQVTVHQAKTHLSRLIKRAVSGEIIVIANRRMPLVKLQPLPGARIVRRLNGAKRVIRRMSSDFNAPLEDFKDYAR
jgi:antitoxin (DNA-binding transcriptional repressor) of toxin-antitoxin stability system